MAVDFMAFGEAFLNRTAEDIMKRKEKAADYEDERKALAESNKALINRRKGIASQQGAIATQAASLGATPEMIDAALNSGPTGLMDLAKNLQDLKTDMGSNWTKEDAANRFDLPEGYVVSEGDLESRIAQVYGLPAASLGSTTAPEANWFSKGMGYGAKDRVRADLDKEAFFGGMSVMDVNEAAQQQDYERLTKGAFVNFTMPDVFKAEDFESESRLLTAIAQRVEETPVYVALKEQYTIIAAKKTIAESPEREEQMAQLNALNSQMRDLKIKQVGREAVNRYDSYNGGGYLEQMRNTVNDLLGGDGLFEELLALDRDEMSSMPEVVSEDESSKIKIPLNSVFAGKVSEIVEANGFNMEIGSNGFTVSGENLPGDHTFTQDAEGNIVGVYFIDSEGEQTDLDAEGVAAALELISLSGPTPAGPEVSLENTDVTNITQLEDGQIINPALISEDMVEGASRYDLKRLGLKYTPLGRLFEDLPNQETVDQRIEQLTIKEEALQNPDKWYRVELPGMLPGKSTRKVKGADLIHLPDAALLNMNYNTPISRLDFDEELPKRNWTVRDIKKAYPSSNAEASTVTITSNGPDRPKARPDGLMSPEAAEPNAAEQLDTVIQASPEAERVLKSHGRDIVAFLIEEGFDGTESSEEYNDGLAAWYDTNQSNLEISSGILLPEDREAVVFAIKKALEASPPA